MTEPTRIAAIIAVFVLAVGGAQGQHTLIDEVQRLVLPVEKQRLADYETNPAQMFFRDSITVSTAFATADILRQETPVMEQLGDGHTLFGLGAQSYMRLTPESVVWGGAQFVTGKYDNIRWTDCVDYLRVAPYVLGDEAGGDLSTRRYSFSGGYSRRSGSWTWGIDAAYRAEIAYRNRDPRVKTIVSDLDLRLGGTYAAGTHSVGLAAALNVYNQSCDLDFYSPINTIDTYTLTGMGTVYRRFMGNTNQNSGYSSLGWSVSAQWLPHDSRGLSAQVDYTSFRMGQQLRNFNNITLGYTDNSAVSFSASYGADLTLALLFCPRIEGRYATRKGTENLFGTAAGASYDKIGSRSPYSLSELGASLSLPLQVAFGTSFVTVEAAVAYDRSLEKYTEPLRKLSASHLTPSASLSFSSQTHSGWLWSLGAGTGYAKAWSPAPVLTGLDTSSALGECVTNNFAMLCADRSIQTAHASISRSFSGFVLSLTASFNHTEYRGKGSCNHTLLALSAAF